MFSHTTACAPSHLEALDPTLKEIRVLDIAPASGDGIVECMMNHISLLHYPVPVYETISYSWGLSRTPSIIKLNGHMTTVPASSEAALRRMRLTDRPRVLWIDAICIDQSSVTERSAQVAIMSLIYRTARRNLIYLGEDDGMAERGVKAIQNVVNDMRTATADLTLLSQTIYDEETSTSLYSTEAFSVDVDFEALEALFSLHWFRRLWVLQEAVLAASSTCHWGTHEFDLLDTVRVARWLVYKYQISSEGLYDNIGWRCAAYMFDFLDPDHGSRSKRRVLLYEMLETCRQFEKTEPKDSIYAILGLIEQGRHLEGGRAALLEVNYTKSLTDILRDATRYALCETNDLRAFREISHSVDVLADSQTFPTWASRADLLYPAKSFNRLPTFFRACEGLETPCSLDDVSSGENVLLLEGLVIDSVLQTTVTCAKPIWKGYEAYHQWLISARNIAMHHYDKAMQDGPHLAIAFTLVAGKANSGKKAQPKDLQVLMEYIKALATCDDGVNSDGLGIKPRVDKERMDELYATSLLACCDRRFFTTTAGRVGIGPRCMQPEDIVVILRGGRTPFILRKKSDGYWLLGDAYVHGVMHGEAVQMERDRGGSEVVFPVR